MADDSATRVMVDNGRIYQLVTVSVRSPLPVAWISMGFELDGKAARELADITGLAVTLSVNSSGHWTDVVSTVPVVGARPSDVVTRRIEISKWGNAEVVAILSRSLAEHPAHQCAAWQLCGDIASIIFKPPNSPTSTTEIGGPVRDDAQ